MGWVVNGQALESVHLLLEHAGLVPGGVALPQTASFDAIARIGGPVQAHSGWLLYRRDPARAMPGEIDVGPDLAVTGDVSVFDGVLRGGEPKRFRLWLGYAGWGPGQLESEVQQGAWLPVPVDAELVFNEPGEKLWEAAYERSIGTGPGAFTSTRRGSA